MTKEKLSPIKIDTVMQQADTIDELSEYVISAETGEGVLYNKTFSQVKIDELTKEFLQDLQYTVENKIDFLNNDQGVSQYTVLLIIKHFSHFKNEIGDTFENKLAHMQALYNIGLTNLFLDEIFDYNEILKVKNNIEKVVINLSNLIDADTEAILEEKTKGTQKRKPRKKKDVPNTNLN